MIKSVAYYIQRTRELGLWETLRRTSGRTRSELSLSGQSLWWGWLALQGMSNVDLLKCTTGQWRSVDALLEHLASRPASSFLLPHESAQETAQLLYHHYSEYISAVLATADAACRNELLLLGQVYKFPKGIDWQCDPVTGWRWPLLHRSRIARMLGSERPVDLICFWELNRHQHFIKLGIAYWLTGDEKYVDSFITQIQNWIETNPLQHGVNWYYPLEVSIRLLAWTAAFQFFRESQKFREKIGATFLKSLWQQADFLNGHLQFTRSDVTNNHLIAELVGLTLVGAAFPEFRAATDWRETGLRLLNQQAVAQTHLDGVNKEQAIGYHRFIAELLLLIVAWSRQDVLSEVPILESTLEKMLDYVLSTLTPVGTVPTWGDSDYGHALGFGENKDFWDFRPILSAGAVLFSRPDWKFAAGRFDEEAFWFLGSNGLDFWSKLKVHPPEQTSQALPHAGLYIIRDTWNSDTDVAFFRCGPFGLGGEGHCAHTHCDLLSFILWVNGQPLLVDSGTFTYHGPWRDPFRQTAAHNTVMIDGLEQAVAQPNFNWRQIPTAKCLDWTSISVTGLITSPSQVTFSRGLSQLSPGFWELTDRFIGHGDHTLEWFFHFAPDLELEINKDRSVFTVFKNGSPFVVGQMPLNGINSQVKASWFSYRYGVKQANQELYAIWQGHLDGREISFHWQLKSVNEESGSK